MRTGLVLVGAAIAAIGVGVLLASFALSTGSPTSNYSTISLPTLSGFSSYQQLVNGTNDSSATVVFSWTSSQHLQVELYATTSCSQRQGYCALGAPLATWWSNSGRWSTSGAVTFPLSLSVTNPNGSGSRFSAALTETYTFEAWTHPSWSLLVTWSGAAVLIVIGGIATFLGLFLKAGVYSPPVEPTPLYLDALDDSDDFEEADQTEIDDEGAHPPGT